MSPAAQHVVPDAHSDDRKQQEAARLLRTSANPLDTPDSTVRPPKSAAAALPIAEEAAEALPNGKPVDISRFYASTVC